MKRIFGTAKKTEAPPVEFGQVSERMDQRTSAYDFFHPERGITFSAGKAYQYSTIPELSCACASKAAEVTMPQCRLDGKINDIDTKLKKYKEQISSARTPAAQRAAKQQALRLLKQKKLYEGQRDQMYAQQMNLESTQFMTEQMKDTADQVAVMKQAQTALAHQMQHVKIDDVDELQEQMQDLWVRLATQSITACNLPHSMDC